jgi:pilus assembly protein TadC
LAGDHKVVSICIIAMLVTALAIFIGTVVVSGGISVDLVEAYVLPLIIASFTLLVFVGVLLAHNRGLIPFLDADEPAEDERPKEN